jgi:hypothetical protein
MLRMTTSWVSSWAREILRCAQDDRPLIKMGRRILSAAKDDNPLVNDTLVDIVLSAGDPSLCSG